MNENLLRAVKLVTTRQFVSQTAQHTPAAMVALCQECVTQMDWWSPDRENTWCFAIDTKQRVIAFWLVCVGTLDVTLLHPREVFRPAIALNAAAVLVMHNHPSGDVTPSKADLDSTRQLVNAGAILRLPVQDHIIWDGNQGWTSLRDTGLVSFNNSDGPTTVTEMKLNECEPAYKLRYESLQLSGGAMSIWAVTSRDTCDIDRSIVATIWPDKNEHKVQAQATAIICAILNSGAIQ